MNTDNDGRRSQRGLEEHFSEFIEGCFSYIEDNFELDQSFSAEFMPNKIDNDEVNTLLSPHIQNEQILPPGTPIVLSPASPISFPSSPNKVRPSRLRSFDTSDTNRYFSQNIKDLLVHRQGNPGYTFRWYPRIVPSFRRFRHKSVSQSTQQFPGDTEYR